MDEFSYELKIPKERVAVLIGSKGETKRDLESETKTSINVDSEEGDVVITGNDSLVLFAAQEMIKAIARGFNPDIAKLLLKTDYALEIVNVLDYAKTKKHSIRIKGRVIGADGKSRQSIEELTGTHISVYGKTISIIGRCERIGLARRAVEHLLSGSPHSSVYKMLEAKQREIEFDKMNQKEAYIK